MLGINHKDFQMTYKPISLFKINFSSPLIVPSLQGYFPDGWRIMVHDPIDIPPSQARCVTANNDTLLVKIFTDDFKSYGIGNKSLLTLDLKATPKQGDIVVFGTPETLQIGKYLHTAKGVQIFNFQSGRNQAIPNEPIFGVVIKIVGYNK